MQHEVKLQRQIVVAVHEKSLFDYLALELSPAFQNDMLIAIELSPIAKEQTLMNYHPHIWEPDKRSLRNPRYERKVASRHRHANEETLLHNSIL